MCESNLDARKKTRRLVGLPVFSHYGSLHRCLAFIQNPASLTPWSSPNPLPPLAASVPATTASSSHARSQICQTNPTPTCSRRSWAARYFQLFSHHLQRMFKLCHHCTYAQPAAAATPAAGASCCHVGRAYNDPVDAVNAPFLHGGLWQQRSSLLSLQ